MGCEDCAEKKRQEKIDALLELHADEIDAYLIKKRQDERRKQYPRS